MSFWKKMTPGKQGAGRQTHPDKANLRVDRRRLMNNSDLVTDNIVITIECHSSDLADVIQINIDKFMRKHGGLTIGDGFMNTDAGSQRE